MGAAMLIEREALPLHEDIEQGHVKARRMVK